MAGVAKQSVLCGIAGLSVLAMGCVLASPTYDFAYRLSGDRRVAPIQVFDDGKQTWLQFAPGQVLPAVFVGQDENSLMLARHSQQGPYLVLEGTAARVEMRIGEIMARADYAGQQPRVTTAVSAGGSSAPLIGGVLAPSMPAAGTRSRPRASAVTTVQTPSASEASGEREALPLTASAHLATRDGLPEAAAPRIVVQDHNAGLEFDAALSDGNMRRVVERWARQAGWMFQSEHWAVDVDIPLIGAATFGPDFRNAVRGLLASTELGERPLQPCFYANKVVRVIPLAQACDRTLAPTAAGRGRS